MRTLIATSLLLAATACAPEQQAADTDLFGAAEADPDLQLTRTDTETSGTLVLDDGSVLTFAGTERSDGTVETEVEFNGMRLFAERGTGDFMADATTLDGPGDPLMTEVDRAALLRLTAALEAEFYPSVAHIETKAQYRELRRMTPAEERLFSNIEGLWAQWPTSVPLNHHVDTLEIERGITERHYYVDNGYYIGGSHDCWDCGWWSSSCTDYKRIGHSFDGCNHGNTGTSCSGTQFTQDAVNHDQCVRTGKHGGHSLASAWCNDQFTSAIDDEIAADSADYDWRGTSLYNNCPTSWDGTDDGCDVHCQFRDNDCPSY